MTVIFASPTATGKTRYGAKLAKHLGCSSVVELEELAQMSDEVRKHKLDNALILCEDYQQVGYCPYIRRRRTLQRDEMNAAMVAVGGRAIWNSDGTINR